MSDEKEEVIVYGYAMMDQVKMTLFNNNNNNNNNNH